MIRPIRPIHQQTPLSLTTGATAGGCVGFDGFDVVGAGTIGGTSILSLDERS